MCDAESDPHAPTNYATAAASRREQILRYLLEHPEYDEPQTKRPVDLFYGAAGKYREISRHGHIQRRRPAHCPWRYVECSERAASSDLPQKEESTGCKRPVAMGWR